jgi:ATP-binding cassette subfamily F protein uup
VLDRVSVQLEPGDRIGVVGANGAGKSTLLDLIAARRRPTGGSVDVGATVRIGYYDQLGRELDLTQRVRDAVAGDKGQPSLEDLALMRRFWFDGDAQFAPMGTLSGGERRRLQLLLTLVEQPNVLLLDEPTNDLDLDTLRALEDLLDDWPGIAVVVSHDRAFLDRTVDEVWAFDGAGGVRAVRGGVAGWLAEREAMTESVRSRSSTSSTSVASKPASTGSTRSTGSTASTESTESSESSESSGASERQRVKPAAGRSPSTVRRQLGQVEREVQAATERRDRLTVEMASLADHRELARIGDELAAAQHELDAAEERWLALAAEAEAIGLDL